MIAPSSLPLPFPVDPITAGISLVKEFIFGLFGIGKPSMKELQDQRRELCRNPQTYRPDVCGSHVWFATYCQDGTIAPEGGSCKCPLSAIIAPGQSGCSRANAIKDNLAIVAGITIVGVILMGRS